MQLYAVKFGESPFKSKYVFRDASVNEPMRIPWSYYVARYRGKSILFDVGFRDPQTAEKWGIELIDVEAEVASAVDLNSIDIIFITHSHFDHIDNIDRFPDAQIIIGCDEYEYALQNASLSVRERLLQSNVLTVKEAELFLDTFQFEVVGGHTVGSSVVYFQHDGANYAITGDECYVAENLTARRPIGIFSNTEKNEAFLKKAHGMGVIPLPFHDPGIFHTYKKVTENMVQII
ncbi:MBL fold metallo-hydrolase [Cohnella sp. LGH]|uniref:MBL fold metallo-hydrolase n=1 Tax=Cohnella sp. LGH TaxID=1619153 RepID=UPI001ADA50BA|nr:MBL fold metallo-hydrolase [Cohnella sp. LGH]QTH41545.1 MBL fold metallo-hydrolase [Cohnella sp. LGH]